MPQDGTNNQEKQALEIHQLVLTIFPNNLARTKTQQNFTLPSLARYIRETEAPRKNALPLVKLAIFGDVASGKGCLRTNANMGDISGIEIEHDAGEISFKQAIRILREAGLRCLIYTTPSHMPVSRERWRVLLPLSRALPKGERKRLVGMVNGLFEGRLARESFTLSQAFYFGSVEAARAVSVTVLDGEFVDLAKNLPAPMYPTPAGKGTTAASGGAAGHTLEELDAMLAACSMRDGEGWWHIMLTLTSSYVARGWKEADIIAKLAPKCRGGAADPQLIEFIESAQRKFGPKPIPVAGLRAALGAQAAASFVNPPNWPGGTYVNTAWPKPNMVNAMAAMKALGIVVRHDLFHNEKLIEVTADWQSEVPDFVGSLTDANMLRIREVMHAAFNTDFKKIHTHEAAELLAAHHQFNPLIDMLAEAEAAWDGVERLDRVAADYFNCEDSEVNAACMRKVLIGAVARARAPGIKFDTVVILESPEGYGKSTAWRIMAGEENFSDENILGLKGREVQEHLQGVWIHESAELAGMSRTESEHVKAQVSRQRDKARAAYAYYAEAIPRSSILVGTTNEEAYLQSSSNRRFWPMTVVAPIDLDRLARDRLQLWGEAAAAQSAGETLVLDKALWPVIGAKQEERRLIDGWEIKLSRLRPVQGSVFATEVNEYCIHIRDGMEVVTTSALMDYLLGKGWVRNDPWMPRKLAGTMRALGWKNFRWRDDPDSPVPIRGYRRPLTVPVKGKVVPFTGTRKDE